MMPHKPAFPVMYQERADGVEIQDAHSGMTLRTYALIEITKALIGRKDSLIFSNDELVLRADDITDALLRKVTQ